VLTELSSCIQRGVDFVHQQLETLRSDAAQVGAVWMTLQPDAGPSDERRAKFDSLRAPFS
jgi:hypothetical protein